jgi:hypothetical protein
MVCERKFEQNRALFTGVLIPTCRGFDILTNLSQNRFQNEADKEKSEEGRTQFKRTVLTGMNLDSGRIWVLLGHILAIRLDRVGRAGSRQAVCSDRACRLAWPRLGQQLGRSWAELENEARFRPKTK